jgi:hypothetical protein
MTRKSTNDPDKLEFPSAIAPIIGLSANEITFLKKRGCPFYGRKTTVRWVRDFISRRAGAVVAEPSPSLAGHLQHSNGSKSGVPVGSSD